MEEDFSQLEQINDSFNDVFHELVDTLKQLSTVSSSPHLFHLTQRMTSCSFLEREGARIHI